MSNNNSHSSKVNELAQIVENTLDGDIYLYSGPINDEGADKFIRQVRIPKRRKNVLLLLATHGGDADAAYRMAHALQRYYEKFYLLIWGVCKSAGTLVAVGCNELILSDYSELGPLDVQLGKKDELFELSSGLDVTQALVSLNTRAMEMFRKVLVDLRVGSEGAISTKTAAEISTQLAVGLYGPIYNQIEPAKLGEIERANKIAYDYGKRLQRNLKPGSLEQLVTGYPSHSFVIDGQEAQELFKTVRSPNSAEEALAECLSSCLLEPSSNTLVHRLPINEVKETTNEQKGPAEPHASSAGTGASVSPSDKPVNPEPTPRSPEVDRRVVKTDRRKSADQKLNS